jgi:subtilisin family serine protease
MPFPRFSLSYFLVCVLLPLGMMAQQGDSVYDEPPLSTLDWTRQISVSPFVKLDISEARAERLHPLLHHLLRISPGQFREQAILKSNDEIPFTTQLDIEVNFRAGVIKSPSALSTRYGGRWVMASQSGSGGFRAVGRFASEEFEALQLFLKQADFHRAAPAQVYSPQLQRVRAETGAAFLHQGLYDGTAYTGKNVMVAVFDTGIDVRHPAFRDPADSTKSRIAYLWDQTITPRGNEVSPDEPFDYGVLYSREDIELSLSGVDFVRSEDTNGHGTHVTGTAAGSNPHMPGIAPEADIVAIKGGNRSFSTFDIINAVRFMGQLSQNENKPLVGNFSIGGQLSPRDGTAATEQAMDEVSQQPGTIMVSAAGNSGQQRRYVEGETGLDAIILNIPEYEPRDGPQNDRLFIDIWFQDDDSARLRLETPSGASYTIDPDTFTTIADSTEGVISVENRVNDVNGDRNITVFIRDDPGEFTPASGQWRLIPEGNPGASWQAWMVLQVLGGTERISPVGASNDYSVTTPGSGISTITAGAYMTTDTWINANLGITLSNDGPLGDLAAFSGRGPTRDERLKPDINAPGRFVAAALSSLSGYPATSSLPGNQQAFLAGTSMASPVVAGGIALLLQARPDADYNQIRAALQHSGRRDDFTGMSLNNDWGGGKLNLIAALQELGVASDNSALNEAWQPGLLFDEGTLNAPDQPDSFYLRPDQSIVQILPRFTGVINSLLVYVGETEQLTAEDVIILQLHEIDESGQRLLRPLGNEISIPGDELESYIYQKMDMQDSGLFIMPQIQIGISMQLESQRAHAALELLRRQPSQTPALLSSRRFMHDDDRLTALPGGQQLFIDAGITRFSGADGAQPQDPPPGYSFPFELQLLQNYPNPFNARSIIPYQLERATEIRLELFDIMGRRVAVLDRGQREAGTYEIPLDTNQLGLASGIYIYRLQAGNEVLVKKLSLIK